MFDKDVSVISVIQALSLFVIFGIAWGIESFGNTLYIDFKSSLFGIILGILVLLILMDSRNRKNPLLFVLSYWTLFYVVLRVFTLNYTEYSVTLKRSEASVNDINYVLLLVVFFTLSLWVSLRYKNKEAVNVNYHIHYDNRSVNRSLNLFWIALFINVISDLGLPVLGSIATIIKQFILSVNNLLFIMIVYFLLVWKNVDKSKRILLGVSVLAFVLFQTLGGSRSGILTIGKMLLYGFLILGYKSIKVKYLLGIILTIPLMFFLFFYSTYMRQMDMQKSTVSEKISIANDVIDNYKVIDTKDALSPVFDRIGFLDMMTEMYKQKDHFSKLVNIEREAMSVIDNALTPGFDLFDAPRISHVITNSYFISTQKLISKSYNTTQDYHSDELTFYGEGIILFGIPLCFIYVFIVGLVIRRCWIRFGKSDDERKYIKRGMILLIFEKLLSSYGLDWLALDLVCFIITYFIFDKYVLKKSSNIILIQTL